MSEEEPFGSDPSLLGQLAEVARKATFLFRDTSVKKADVYGPGSHLAINEAWHGPQSQVSHVPGTFYLMVLRGDFVSPRAVGPRERLAHRAFAVQLWSPTWSYLYGGHGLSNSPPATLSRLGSPTEISVAYRKSLPRLLDYGPRYQLLDNARSGCPLWDCWRNSVVRPLRGEAFGLHRERTPDDLRPELERLLRAGHLKVVEKTDDGGHVLRLDEGLEAIGNDRNWYAPYDLDEPERRSVIYQLALPDSGRAELEKEHARTEATWNPGNHGVPDPLLADLVETRHLLGTFGAPEVAKALDRIAEPLAERPTPDDVRTTAARSVMQMLESTGSLSDIVLRDRGGVLPEQDLLERLRHDLLAAARETLNMG